jgi:cytochrome c-type biogenesis protein CcmF
MQYVTLKAYKFPFINLLWAGTLIMVLGFFISMFNRLQTKNLKRKEEGTAGRKEILIEMDSNS